MYTRTYAIIVLLLFSSFSCKSKQPTPSSESGAASPGEFNQVTALQGPLKGVHFGMSSAEAAKVIPSLKAAFKIRGKDRARTDGEWQVVGGVECILHFSDENDMGLVSIIGRIPEKEARQSLEKWLGPGERPGGRFDWTFWFNENAHTRTVLLRGEDGYARIEIMPYQSLERALSDGGAFTYNGSKPLIGARLEELKTAYGSRLVYLNQRPAMILLDPAPYGSGYISLNLDFKDSILDEYKFTLDFTYAPNQHTVIAKALQKVLGTGRSVQTGLGKCQAYSVPGDTSTPLADRQCQPTDYACDRPEVIVCDRSASGITTHHIEVKRPYTSE